MSVGNGDMFYIKHNSSNFTIIDCCMSDDQATDRIISEIVMQASGKEIVRFISTHPDDDHIRGLVDLDDAMNFLNFYCVANEATKIDATDDFDRYCELRDHASKAFHIDRGCSRKWMNEASEERGQAGIDILWPKRTNAYYQAALADAKRGDSANNISCILKYSIHGGATFLWMGDLESDFMENVMDDFMPDPADILFAPHHGRDSGKVPVEWLDMIAPKIVIIGEAPARHLNYYTGYDTITQNSAGDITFECVSGKVHIYVSNEEYSVDFLDNEYESGAYGEYIGTLNV